VIFFLSAGEHRRAAARRLAGLGTEPLDAEPYVEGNSAGAMHQSPATPACVMWKLESYCYAYTGRDFLEDEVQ